MTTTDPIIVIERPSGMEYRVDTSHADTITTEDVEALRAQRIHRPTPGLAADWLIRWLSGDTKGSECVCPNRRWYKRYFGTLVYEMREVSAGVWNAKVVGRIVK